jgi:hypothetical protein
MPIAYCPNCKKNVTTTRKDIDAGLAIFLCCCTGGIGLLVYLIVYFSQNETQCIFCSTETVPLNYEGDHSYSQVPTSPVKDTITSGPNALNNTSANSFKKYCPYCGTALIEGQKFCENCGGDLKEQ